MPIYLKLASREGQAIVRGAVRKRAHRGWIELTRAEFGKVSSPVSPPADGEAPLVRPSEIVIAKALDCASPALFRYSMEGELMTAVIDFVKDDGAIHLRATLEAVLIANYTVGSGKDVAYERLTLESAKVSFETGIKPAPSPRRRKGAREPVEARAS
jgi:type VI protein secretion system component Hcp